MINPVRKGGTFTPAAESHGLWPWMNAPTFGRDVAPLGRYSGATGFARGAPPLSEIWVNVLFYYLQYRGARLSKRGNPFLPF